MPLAPGSTVGRYQLRSRLGGGAMGVVWLAHDPDLERRVALKLISPALADDPDFRARFLREARAAAAVDHPHVLPVYEAGTADGVLYLAMRYVPGVDLASRLARSGPLSLEATVSLVEQLAAALAAAHAAGVIHRDLKPANVLLGPDDHAYLADFGLARSAAAPGLTRPGQLVGTAAYTAPELLAGTEASPASDTYALACLAVEALTGAPPFTAPDELATLYAHAHAPPPQLIDRRPDLPPALQAVIERGLAKDPAGRYPEPLAFAAGLGAAMRAEGTEAASRAPLQTSSHPPQHWAGAISASDSRTHDAKAAEESELLIRKLTGHARRRRVAAAAAVGLSLVVLAVVLFGAAMSSEGIGGQEGVSTASPGRSTAVDAAAPTVSAPASPRDVAAPVADGAFPNETEQDLLALVDPSWRSQCRRALAEDAPDLLLRAGSGGGTERLLHITAPAAAGIECRFGGTPGVDTVLYWLIPPFMPDHALLAYDPSEPVNASVLVQNRAGSAPAASCEAVAPALERWSFGGTGGLLYCYTDRAGDAVLEWTYDGSDIVGRAVRVDGDVGGLLDWWREEARFAP